MLLKDWPQGLPLRPEWKRWAFEHGGRLPASAERWFGTNEDVIPQALSRHRDHLFADLVASAIVLACETHPEAIVDALARVFDLEGARQSADRVLNVLASIQKTSLEARHLVEEVHCQLEEIDKRIDALNYEVERHEREDSGVPAKHVVQGPGESKEVTLSLREAGTGR